MAAVTIYNDFGAPKNKLKSATATISTFLHLFAMKWRDQMPWS